MRLPFEYWHDGGLYWARYVRSDEGPVREHWPGLTDDDAIEEIDAAHWHAFGVNNNNQEEVAVYLRIAWALLSRYEVLGAPIFYAGDAANQLGQSGSAVRWQIETESEGPPGCIAKPRIVPARSSVQLRPPPTEEQRWLRDKSLLFRIRSFNELATILRVTLSDAGGEVNLYGGSEASAVKMIDELRRDAPPSLPLLLGLGNLFIDIGIGVDLGYNDYLLVASKEPVEPVLGPVLMDAERAIVHYESKMSAFVSPREALILISELAGER